MPSLAPATPAVFWEDIDEQVLGAPAAAVTFSGIDTAFTVFAVTAYMINDANASVFALRLNNDAAGNYDMQKIDASAAVVTGVRTLAQNEFTQRTGMAASQESSARFVIAKPLAAEEAQMVYQDSTEAAAGIVLNFLGGQWNNVLALISRIDVLKLANNLDTGTRILLEGGKPV